MNTMLVASSCVNADWEAHPEGKAGLPVYELNEAHQGMIVALGDDSMYVIMALWEQGFKAFHPKVKFHIDAEDSSLGFRALLDGRSRICMLPHGLTTEEMEVFKAKYGYEPTIIKVFSDAVEIIVHKDNPVKGLSIPQVQAIFANNPPQGQTNIQRWGDVGLTGEWSDRPVQPNAVKKGKPLLSGTIRFFNRYVLENRNLKETVKEHPNIFAKLDSMKENPSAISYGVFSPERVGFRTVPLRSKEKGVSVVPNIETVFSGAYPLARHCYLALNIKPGTEIEPLYAEFLKFIYSQQGQAIAIKDAYFPLKSSTAAAELKRLGLDKK